MKSSIKLKPKSMKINDLQKLKKTLLDTVSNQRKTAILTHTKPDGDGIGAALALQEILLANDLRTEIILENKLPENYQFLEPENKILIYSDELTYDNLIVLDCHERSRLGSCEPLLDKAKKVIAIDHHLESNVIDSDYYIDPTMVSVGAIIYRMFQTEINNLKADRALYIASAVYISILNDTDNFINANTDEETFRICAELRKTGMEPGYVTKQFLLNKTAREMKYIGTVLTTIEEQAEGRVVFVHSLRSMLKESGLPASVNSKILRWVKGLRNVDIVVYFSETSPRKYKLSLRSNLIDVNRIAVRYGGGGHKKASGCSLDGELPQIKQIILEEIKKQL